MKTSQDFVLRCKELAKIYDELYFDWGNLELCGTGTSRNSVQVTKKTLKKLIEDFDIKKIEVDGACLQINVLGLKINAVL